MSILNPFQLLELNVISAQDLAPVSRSMRTYAVAWVHPDRKLSTRVDTHGHANPTWNDKFVFRVDEEFLHADTSAVMIEIYALHWFKDVHVGTVRILVGNLIPAAAAATSSSYTNNGNLGMRFVALQVRRPSGRPQGILNIGVAILHSAMRSMPIYSQLSTSAVGYRELMGEESPYRMSTTPRSSTPVRAATPAVKASAVPEKKLRRTKSDTSSMIGSEMRAKEFRGRVKGESSGSGSGRDRGEGEGGSDKKGGKSGSAVDGGGGGRKKKGRSKGSSVVSGLGGFGGKGKNGKKSGGSVVSNIESEIIGQAVVVHAPRNEGSYQKGKVRNPGPVGNIGSEEDPAGFADGSDKSRRTNKGKKGRWGKVMSSLLNGHSEVDSVDEEEEEVEEEFEEEEEEEEESHKKVRYYPKKAVESKPLVKPSRVNPVISASPIVKASPRVNLKDRGGGGGNGAVYKATPRRVSPPRKSPRRHTPPGKSPYVNKFTMPYEYGTPRKTPMVAGRGMVFMTESELGPSPSEVAAAIAKRPPPPTVDETESSVLGGWSIDETVEGLRSKLDRWRTELPPVYDRGELSSYRSSEPHHVRRHTDGGSVGGGAGIGANGGNGSGNGLFSCFSNICGVECSIVCGGGSGSSGSKRGGMSERIMKSPSADNLNYK